MKLDLDVIRDILLFLEDEITVDNNGTVYGASVDDIANHFQGKYEKGQIIYTCRRLEEGEYITGRFDYASGKLYYSFISAITYQGHEFLNLIRDETTWGKTKKAAGKIGSFAISVITDIAKQIITGAITAFISGAPQ